MQDLILIHEADGVLELRFNRPEKKNAITGAMYDALTAALHNAMERPAVRAVLIGELSRFLAIVESHTGHPVLLRISPAIERRYRLSAAMGGTLWATGNLFPPTYFTRPWRLWRASDMRRVEGADRAVGWDVVAR